jgi:hypothetical protein
MMKPIAKISMFIAVAFLILHGLLPHHHHEEMDGVQHFAAHETADNWIDYLQLAFHLNPGENHLEDYHLTDFSPANILLVTSLIYPNRSWIDQYQVEYSPVNRKKSTELIDNHPFRGPPIFS